VYSPPREKSTTSWSVFDLTAKEAQLDELQKQSEDPDLWQNPDRAQQVMKKLASMREEVTFWQGLNQRAADLVELSGLDDESLRAELEREIEAVEAEVDRLEFEAMLSGPYDRGNALLAIHAGAGGTDSQDWAEMLQRMYLRWAERQNFQTEILDLTEGEEAGIKSTTIAVNGRYAYGYLRPEKGVHRLVRLSPFDSAHRRHTSFALVEILPEIER
jgi:peptide chain release factor 2